MNDAPGSLPGGQGGAGNATGRGNQAESDLDLQTVYQPPQRAESSGDDLRLTGRPDPDQAELPGGTAQGDGLRNDALVPYRDLLPTYAEQATRTIEQGGYPARLRSTVRNYFDALAAPGDP